MVVNTVIAFCCLWFTSILLLLIALCRRRLSTVLVRLKFAEHLREAVTYIEQGHIRVGPETVTDPAFLVTRNMEDFITWVDSSKIKRKVLQYNDKLDDYDAMNCWYEFSPSFLPFHPPDFVWIFSLAPLLKCLINVAWVFPLLLNQYIILHCCMLQSWYLSFIDTSCWACKVKLLFQSMWYDLFWLNYHLDLVFMLFEIMDAIFNLSLLSLRKKENVVRFLYRW